jgi:UDP-N-acetylglucosamine acyltransferase
MGVTVGANAIVSKKAKLGENVTVGPSAIIGDDVVIGDGTSIAPFAVVQSGTRMGKECRVASFSVLGGAPQDLKYKDEPTTLQIGDRCDIREYVTLNRGTTATGKTMIGNGCMFMANTHVAHDCVVGDYCIMANSSALAGHVTIGNWVVIGGLVPIHQFVRIGDHVIIGGGYRVPKDIPPYIRTGREPLVYEGLNSVGLRRRGFSQQQTETIEKAYFILYRSKLNVSQAVARIKEELEQTDEIKNILNFIAGSKRGIISGPGDN